MNLRRASVRGSAGFPPNLFGVSTFDAAKALGAAEHRQAPRHTAEQPLPSLRRLLHRSPMSRLDFWTVRGGRSC